MKLRGFSDTPAESPDAAKVHLLPVPLEMSVSYGEGTAHGPTAILEASYQLENFDREFVGEPLLEQGVYTLPSLDLPKNHQEALSLITREVSKVYREDKLLGILGGEHSLSAAVVDGLPSDQAITVVQFDAHCDLRDSYDGTGLSHACVARRLLEKPQVEQILQLGIRSLCREEYEVLQREERVRCWFAEDLHDGSYLKEFRERLGGRRVYLSLDVDAFCPSLVPSTGTPEPGGLSFSQVEEAVRVLLQEAELLAFDCVELAPQVHHHASDFFVAKFLWKLMVLYLSRAKL